jgi:hypothetical protein
MISSTAFGEQAKRPVMVIAKKHFLRISLRMPTVLNPEFFCLNMKHINHSQTKLIYNPVLVVKEV